MQMQLSHQYAKNKERVGKKEKEEKRTVHYKSTKKKYANEHPLSSFFFFFLLDVDVSVICMGPKRRQSRPKWARQANNGEVGSV